NGMNAKADSFPAGVSDFFRITREPLIISFVVGMLDKNSQELERVHFWSRSTAMFFIHLIELGPGPALILGFFDDDSRKFSFHHGGLDPSFDSLFFLRRGPGIFFRTVPTVNFYGIIFIGIKTKSPEEPRRGDLRKDFTFNSRLSAVLDSYNLPRTELAFELGHRTRLRSGWLNVPAGNI